MSEGQKSCEKCGKITCDLYYEWYAGNPCDATYGYVCKECKGPTFSNFTSDMIY